MKSLTVLLFPILFTINLFGQTITYDDFKTVIPYLQKEDFKGAYEKTSQLLESTKNDSSDLRGIVTYINIFSACGLVSLDQMSFETFEKNTRKFLGQYVVMSAHPCIDTTLRAFNSVQFHFKENGKFEGSTTTSNNQKTSILCFEYFEYAEDIVPSNFIGKNVRNGGILTKIEPNPNKSKIWIARLRIKNAFVRAL